MQSHSCSATLSSLSTSSTIGKADRVVENGREKVDSFGNPFLQWRPLRWSKPKLLEMLEERPEFAEYVQSLRIRVEPFPAGGMSMERFSSNLRNLEDDSVIDPHGLPLRLKKMLDGSDERLRRSSLALLYCVLLDASNRLWGQGEGRIRGSDLAIAEDAAPLVCQVTSQLMNLEHMEPAKWRAGIYRRDDNEKML